MEGETPLCLPVHREGEGLNTSSFLLSLLTHCSLKPSLTGAEDGRGGSPRVERRDVTPSRFRGTVLTASRSRPAPGRSPRRSQERLTDVDEVRVGLRTDGTRHGRSFWLPSARFVDTGEESRNPVGPSTSHHDRLNFEVPCLPQRPECRHSPSPTRPSVTWSRDLTRTEKPPPPVRWGNGEGC